jgi:hypothetical protein
MKRSSISWLALAALALVVLAIVVAWRDNVSTQPGAARLGEKVLPGFPAADVAQITLRNGSDVTTLRRGQVGWTVVERDYPADETRIRDLLLKVLDLKVLQSDPVTAAQRERLELAEPGKPGGGTSVEFADTTGKPAGSLLVGKQYLRGGNAPGGSSPAGRYLMVGGNDGQVVVVAELLSDVIAKPPAWLAKDFVRIDKARSISVAAPSGTTLWTIEREAEGKPWRFADGTGSPDEAKADQVARAFESTGFTDVVGRLAEHSAKLDGATTVTIDTFDSGRYTVRIGAQATPEQRYFAVAGGKEAAAESYARWLYLMPNATIEPLLRPRDQLLPEKEKAKSG